MSLIKSFLIILLLPIMMISCSEQATSNAEVNKKIETINDSTNTNRMDTISSPNEWFYYETINGRIEIKLSPRCISTLKKHSPEFKLYEWKDFVATCSGYKAHYFKNPNPPFATIGDFNADGLKDLALMGFNSKNTFFMAILSDTINQSYHFTNFYVLDYQDPAKNFLDEESNRGLFTYLYTQKRKGIINNKEILLDYIILEHCDKASTGFYFEGTKLKFEIVMD